MTLFNQFKEISSYMAYYTFTFALHFHLLCYSYSRLTKYSRPAWLYTHVSNCTMNWVAILVMKVQLQSYALRWLGHSTAVGHLESSVWAKERPSAATGLLGRPVQHFCSCCQRYHTTQHSAALPTPSNVSSPTLTVLPSDPRPGCLSP